MKKDTKEELKLNLGSGVRLVPGFTNVDNYFTLEDLKSKKGLYAAAVIPKGAKFVKADMSLLPFEDNSADYIEAFDSIEHVGFYKIEKVLSEMYRVLKPGKKLCLMTINFDQLADYWATYVKGNKLNLTVYKELQEIIYGNQVGPGEFHNLAFNPEFLGKLLMWAGFKPKNIKMTIYPMNSPMHPKSQTVRHAKGMVHRSEMIWVEAKK